MPSQTEPYKKRKSSGSDIIATSVTVGSVDVETGRKRVKLSVETPISSTIDAQSFLSPISREIEFNVNQTVTVSRRMQAGSNKPTLVN